MHAKFYERKMSNGFNDKPVLEEVFELKRKARRNGKAGVKTLFLTADELMDLQREVKIIGKEIGYAQVSNDEKTVAKLLGMEIELIEELEDEEDNDVEKVA